MKCTWPTRKFCVWYPTQPIFHWLTLGFCVGGNANLMFCIGDKANFSVFGTPNAKLWRWGSKPKRGPNVNGLALKWNIDMESER